MKLAAFVRIMLAALSIPIMAIWESIIDDLGRGRISEFLLSYNFMRSYSMITCFVFIHFLLLFAMYIIFDIYCVSIIVKFESVCMYKMKGDFLASFEHVHGHTLSNFSQYYLLSIFHVLFNFIGIMYDLFSLYFICIVK